MFCTYCPNLVILAWIYDELSCGQSHDWHTYTRRHHTHTYASNNNTWSPKLALGVYWNKLSFSLMQWIALEKKNHIFSVIQTWEIHKYIMYISGKMACHNMIELYKIRKISFCPRFVEIYQTAFISNRLLYYFTELILKPCNGIGNPCSACAGCPLQRTQIYIL